MSDHTALSAAAKTDFTDAYAQPDPRSLYRALAPLGYQIPQRALPVIERAVSGVSRVLDVCCSYGVNAALLRCRTDLAELEQRCAQQDADGATPQQVLRSDREFFRSRARPGAPDVVGLDVSRPALDYATRAGLLADAWAENLEADAPSPNLVAGLRGVGAIVCTGGVGYVGAATFDRLLAAVTDPTRVRVVAFVLRVFPYDAIEAVCAKYGLVTERLDGVTFRQRRFAGPDEAAAAVRDVTARGLDPDGKEADGWYHADCYVTRPAEEVARAPLAAWGFGGRR